ncbi:RHS repeat-associated core domain-containing protein [Pseudomonas fluorescens]|uniref:RHS repeat-associated core domain-containing protein n=1 Tax=Pseudomonas fluorescens TaxID=294 RepID=UPI00259B4E0F|nr:RHS repeat-associated core domain-containing protein [Pseudomonas fluorescens]WJK11568.1 RHS repeat-associated core domain-containing protein [Pseudomonas fluorescens]
MHSHTPVMTVTDPRGLVVRDVAYYRAAVGNPIERRVTHQAYDASRRATKRYDPRLFLLLDMEPDIPASLRTVFNLAGEELLTDNVDIGCRVHLSGPAGQPVDSWDSRSTHFHTAYDELIRPVKETVRVPGQAERTCTYFSYGGSGVPFAERNQCGQLIRQDDNAGTKFHRSYSLKGELLENTQHFLEIVGLPDWPSSEVDRDLLHESGTGATSRSCYSATSQLLSEIDAKSNARIFNYQVDGQVAGIKVKVGKDGALTDVITEIRYNALNKVEQQTLANGLVCSASYSPVDGRLYELKSQIPGHSPLQHLVYRYDPVGNVVAVENRVLRVRYFRNQKIDPVRTFRYDTSYQLIGATGWQVIGGSAGPSLPEFQSPADSGQLENYTESFDYDCSGNLIKQVISAAIGSRTQQMVVSKYSNRALVQKENGDLPTEAEIAQGHDLAGNKLSLLPGQKLEWDERNRLCRVGTVVRPDLPNDDEAYVYDHGGQRLRKIRTTLRGRLASPQEVRYLGALEVRTGSSSSLQVINVQAELCDVRVLNRTDPRSGKATVTIRFAVTDQIGSCCLELDETGALISEEAFSVFGRTVWWAGSDRIKASDKTRRFSGKERDLTGLYYYGVRYYVPWWHQWLSPDPGGVVDGLNLYRMVGNNPVTFFDDAGFAGTDINVSSQGNYESLVASFSAGDILFGLREPRDAALKALEKVGFKEFSRVPLWRGGLPRVLWEKKRNVLKQNDLTDAAFGPTVTAGIYRTNEQIKSELVDVDRGIGYKEFAMTNRYFQRDEKGTGNFFEINVPMWRRSSKAGLEYQIFGRNKKVLFAIDNLMETLDDIVAKTAGAGTSVTASEIRYVYRRKDTPEVKNNVKFFVADREVPQAEFFALPAWKNYQPRKTFKSVAVPRRTTQNMH